MAKKVLSILIAFLILSSVAFATTLEQAVDAVSKRLFVENLVDKNVLRLYADYGFVDEKYIPAFAGSLYSGLLCPDGKMLRPKSEDLSSLIKGLIRFGISSETFDVVSLNDDITLNNETLYIVDNEVLTDYKTENTKSYYALVNRDKRAYIVWQATKEIPIWLFNGKLFLEDNGKYIITSAKKKSFNSWSDVSQEKYTTVRLIDNALPTQNKFVINQTEVNINFLDARVQILGSYYDGVIKASYFEIK